MKILFATSSFNGGGITSYANEVISNYSEENDFYVLIGSDKKMPINKKGVKVIYCENSDLSVENAKKVLRIINEDVKPDVIISSNSRIISFISPYILNNIKLITVSHSQKYIETDTASFNSKYIDTIVALSQFNKQYIERRFHIRDINKTEVIYNFVQDVKDVETILVNKKEHCPLNIVYMGGSSGSKSPDIVFQIMLRLAQTDLKFNFFWLGNDLFKLGKILPPNHISSYFKGDSRFIFTGRLPREKALEISSSANILLIPSRREGCPMAMLEAMRTGVITITSDFKNACQELVVNNVTGLIIPHRDIDTFVNAISNIISFHHNYYSFYSASYDFFKSNLSFNQWKSKMDRVTNEKDIKHKKRKSSFSVVRYKIDIILFSLLDFQNKIDKMINERLRIITPFVKRYYFIKGK